MHVQDNPKNRTSSHHDYNNQVVNMEMSDKKTLIGLSVFAVWEALTNKAILPVKQESVFQSNRKEPVLMSWTCCSRSISFLMFSCFSRYMNGFPTLSGNPS